MKATFTIIISLITFSTYSQMKNWYGSDLSTLGYKYNNVLIEKQAPNYPNSTFNYKDSNWFNFKGGSSEFSADIYSEHSYFHLDGSILTDMLIVYATNIEKSESWWFKKEGVGTYDQAKFLPIRLAYGDNITPYFNLYAGGQWQYSFYGIEPENNTKYETLFLGGRQMGYGVHATFSYGPVLIRQSFMQDWISRAGTFKGNGITHETMLYVGFKNFGLFAKYVTQSITMNEGEYSVSYDAHFKNKLKTNTKLYAEQNLKFTNFSFGIFASGLMSGISRGISSSVADTEIKKRNERIRKKKTTIEWKE